MARVWMQGFGSSLTVSRTLPALLSLLSLSLIYGLAIELFASRLTAMLATAILALSPFDILFAQTARQYSLLAVTVIGSSFLLLRALRASTWQNWGLYTLACVLGLYTHPFFGLTLIGHSLFVICRWLFAKDKGQRILLKYLLAIASSLILYSPWLVVLTTNYQRAFNTTSWATVRVDFLYLVKLWLFSFTSLFIDLDVGFDSPWTYLLRLPFFLLIAAAIYTICRQTSRYTRLFILTSIFVPFLMLALPDLLLGGKRSAVTRYLICCFPGVQLAVAYLLANKLVHGKLFWRGVLALVLTGSIFSCVVSAFSDTWWGKGVSYYNGLVAKAINATESPLIISDRGDNFTNQGNLISLSYLLDDDVRLLLLSYPPNVETLQGISVPSNSEVLLFQPSGKLREALEQEQGHLEWVLPAGGLLRLK